MIADVSRFGISVLLYWDAEDEIHAQVYVDASLKCAKAGWFNPVEFKRWLAEEFNLATLEGVVLTWLDKWHSRRDDPKKEAQKLFRVLRQVRS